MSNVIIVFDGNPEFEKLVKSIGYNITGKVYFKNKKTRINPRYYISKGKIEEIKELLRNTLSERVLIDAILKSSQWYKLEKELKIPVDDRIKLIIDIFEDRAKTKESMMQVEYANLKYELSHIKELIHQLRIGEHPGFMGGGEYEIADYYERIKKKMAKIQRDLEKLKIQREERRKRRREEGYILVGIAGYTNAGKSTLLKVLSGKNILIEDKMFSTLSTKTSKVPKEKIIITDTVGFVQNMPIWLINAFEPTLEEIYRADIVLILFDCHDDLSRFKEKISLSLEILEGKTQGKYIPVINKIDNCSDITQKTDLIKKEIGEPILISAKRKIGIDKLITRIKKEMKIKKYYVEIDKNSKAYEYIMKYGKIINITEMEKIGLNFEMPISKYHTLKLLLSKNSTGNDGVLE